MRWYLCASEHQLEHLPDDADGVVVPYPGLGVATLLPRYPTEPEAERMIREAADRGLRVQALADFTCSGCEHLSASGHGTFRSTLEYLTHDLEVDGLVVADPYAVELAAGLDVTVVVSHTAAVDTPEKAWYFDRLGADVITVDPSLNEDESTVDAVRERVSARLRAAVNAVTWRDPVAYFERNLRSHLTRRGESPSPYKNDPYGPLRGRKVVRGVREELFDEVLIILGGEPP